MKDPLFVITTSDNHIGYLSVEQMVKEYYGEGGFLAQVESLIEENEIPKGQLVLAITGDYFDHQLSLNSNDASFAIDLMYSIIQIVVKCHEGLVILVQGTRSHDLNQLSIFEHLTEEYAGSFEIVKTVEAFEYKGYDILCVPEEYMTNPTEYYAEYFKEKYDLVLGHGLKISPLV